MANPALFWANYYRKHDESPQNLREKIALLNLYKKFADVQAVLIAYLTYRSKSAEPWMYTALALALEENKGRPEEIRRMFTFSADAARRSQNPNHLVSAADILYLHKQYDLAGPLIDQAMDKVPHRGEPILLSILLAEATKDPRRMTDSVEKLLAQGWPINDEAVRRDAHQKVEKLAKMIREDGRGDEADALLAHLSESEARDIFLRLTWTGDADFDLSVDEPLGATASYLTPRTPFGGAIVKNGYGNHPEEVYVCPRGFDGDYTIKINMIYNNPEKPATHLTLEVFTHEGAPQEAKQTHTISLSGGKSPRPIVATLKGGRRKVVLPIVFPAPGLPANAATDQGRKPTTHPNLKGSTPRESAPKAGAEKDR